MKTLTELRNRLNEILQKMGEIDTAETAAKRNFLENAEYARLKAELTPLEDQIRSAEAAEEERRKRTELTDRAKQKAPGLEDPAPGNFHNRAEDAPFASLGEFLQCVRAAATQPSAIDPRLQKRAALGANELVGSEGGFLVGKDMSAEILREINDVGIIAPRCRPIPISVNSNGITINGVDETSRADASRSGGVLAYWQSEAEATTATKPKFRKIDLKLNKLMALYYATDEVIADAAALGALAGSAFAEEMAFKIDDAIIRGDGAGKPLGILLSGCLVSVAKESSQVADTIMYENVVKMLARMTPRSLRNAVWYINQEVNAQLPLMTVKVKNVAGTENVGGSAVYIPPSGAAGAPFGTLLGRPISVIEHAAALGDQGDIILADFSQYLLATKGGLQQAESMHVQFLTGEMTYRFTYRCDGQPARKSALTPYKGSSTLSPFVVLDARA